MIEVCGPLKAGENGIFDKAYVHFEHLYSLDQRGVFWVTRAKENMVQKNLKKRNANILRDDEIVLSIPKSKRQYPQRFRRIEAEIQIDGKNSSNGIYYKQHGMGC